ncbi:MAG: hypothetical protein ACR2K3_03640 [Nocardioides sp.]
MIMKSRQGLGLLTLTMLLLGCSSGTSVSSAKIPSPVITRVADSRIPYPAALVTGRLALHDGCLMIGTGVVFWPAGTSWDDGRREVVFRADFRGSPNASVDSSFTGGGGLFDGNDDLSGVLSADAEAVLRECLSKTGATHALLIYPGKP